MFCFETTKNKLIIFVDSHTHIQSDRLKERIHEVLERSKKAGVERIVACGTSPDDWNDLRVLAESHSQVLTQYGVHPWYVNEKLPNDYLEKLRQIIQSSSTSNVGIGEIGLDKHFPNLASIERQTEVFEGQLELACDLYLPVTIHSVKAHAQIFAALTKYCSRGLKSPIILHSFNGNLEQLEMYSKRFSTQIYFSINCRSNRENVIKKIPIDQLLIETDSPDMPGEDEGFFPKGDFLLEEASGVRLNDSSLVARNYQRIAKIRCVSLDLLKKCVFENFKRAFRL
jgi:TatD DNase family protein